MSTILLAADPDTLLLGIGIALLIAIGILVLAIGVGSLVAGIMRMIVAINYWFPSRTNNSAGITGGEAANRMLEAYGLNDVQVKQAGFFTAMFYGNHYNPKKKTIYLVKSTYAKQSLTAVGLSVQKVGLVLQHKRDSKAFMTRWKLQRIAILGPLFFVPLVIVGLIIDGLFVAQGADFTGIGMLVFSVIAFVFFVLGFVFQGLTISVEKKGNAEARDMLAKTNLLTPEEQAHIRKVLNNYIMLYVADFILSILEAIKLVFQIFWLILTVLFHKK